MSKARLGCGRFAVSQQEASDCAEVGSWVVPSLLERSRSFFLLHRLLRLPHFEQSNPVSALCSISVNIYTSPSTFLMPARLPAFTLLIVKAAIKAAPTPLPSSAAKILIGSFSPCFQSSISLSATAPLALK